VCSFSRQQVDDFHKYVTEKIYVIYTRKSGVVRLNPLEYVVESPLGSLDLRKS
jgi:hypothetical protein